MITRSAVRLATAMALTASLTGLGMSAASAAPATSSFPCSASGVGNSLFAAEHDAEATIRGDYTVLSGFTLVYSTQHTDGSWFAVVTARCGNPR